MTEYQDPSFPAIFKSLEAELREFDRQLLQILEQQNQNLTSILGRGFSIDDNMDARRVSVTSHVSPGTEFSVAHGLGKVPADYIRAGQDLAGDLFDGTTANTKTTLYLKSDTASVTFRIIVF